MRILIIFYLILPFFTSAQTIDTGHISVRMLATGANDFDINVYKKAS
jgi:hypothetical protein